MKKTSTLELLKMWNIYFTYRNEYSLSESEIIREELNKEKFGN